MSTRRKLEALLFRFRALGRMFRWKLTFHSVKVKS